MSKQPGTESTALPQGAPDYERNFRALFERTNDAVFLIGLDGRFIAANRNAASLLGCDPDELVGVRAVDFTAPDDGQKAQANLQRLLDGQELPPYELRMITKAGAPVQTEIDAALVRDVDGTPVYVQSIVRDICAQKAEEQQRRLMVEGLSAVTGEDFFRTMVRHFAAAVGVRTAFVAELLDDRGKRARTIAFLRFGEFTRNMEYEVEGTPCETVLQGKFRIYPEAVQELFPEDRDLKELKATGYLGIPLRDSKRRTVIGHLVAIHDRPLSPDLAEDSLLKVFASRAGAEVERRRIEEQLLQARKMESVSLLAGGIAHDFNNLLMGILGNISLARDRIDPSDRAHRLLREAERAVDRAKRLTQQLLTLSKGGAPIRRATSVSKLVRESTELALSGSNVRAEYVFPPDLWSADVDRGQIGQVIENLVINAVQAMPQGGDIRIAGKNVTLGTGRGDSLEAGDYVRLEIRDQGPGIPLENLGRIFDPYFTTKEDGTGLGLTTSYAIVTKHGGKLEVHPASGGGSNFVIHIPGQEREPEDVSIPGKVRFLDGPRRVLFMDDEEMVRAVVEEMLTNLGYEVELATDGEDAVEKYREAHVDGIPFDAVILDLTVRGGLGGKDGMRRLINIDPNAVGIVCSGYSDDPVMAEFEQYGFQGRISKPFVATTLSETLASVLDD